MRISSEMDAVLDQWLALMQRWAESDSVLSPPRLLAREGIEVAPSAQPDASRVSCSQVELEVPYLDIAGRPQSGAARLLLPEGGRPPVPLVAAMHYELSPEGALPYLEEGWAVLTTRQGLVAAGDSLNFGSALVHLARLMSFADPAKIALVGGSAGGYASLMVAADAFPLAGIAPFVPPLHLAYTMAYLHHAAEVAACPECFPTDPKEWEEFSRQLPVPVVCYVQSIVRDLEALLGPYDANAENWYRASPLANWPLITCPVLLAYSTADILVPMQQLDARCVRQADLAEFPPGYSFDFDVVLPKRAGPDSLAEVIDPNKVATLTVPIPESLPAVWEEAGPEASGLLVEAPFSAEKQVSLVVLDEGPPHPRATHTKRRFAFSSLAFLRGCFARPMSAEALTLAQLERLMRRLLGEEPDGLLDCRQAEPQPLHRRSSPAREKADILLGLKAYAEAGDANIQKLAALYAQLPPALRALDEPGKPFEADVPSNLQRMLAHLRLPTD